MAAIALCNFTAFADFDINSKDDLVTFRDKVNSGTTYEGETVYLNVDVDLGNASWTPIANTTNADGNGFRGTFDGKGHKISNFSVSITKSGTPTYAFAGFFGLNRGNIKNLHISNANIYAEAQRLNNDSFAGTIAAINRGTITNCMVSSTSVKAHNNYGVWHTDVTPCSSIAAGIAAAQWGGTVSNCYVTDNVTIETTRKTNSTKLYSNRIANNWEEQDRSGTVSNCCTSNSEYANSVCNAKNNAAIVYTNWGTAPSGYPNEPYLWNANGITPNVNTDFVLLGVDNSQAQAGSIRNNAIVLHNANKKDFSYNGTTYALYPAGSNVVVEFYLEGHVGDWSSQDYGYYVEQITDNNGNILAETNDATYTSPENGMDEEGNSTFSYETGRFLRKQQYTIAMPSAMTTLSYTTIAVIPSSVEGLETEACIYGANGCVVVEAATDGNITIVDMAGRIVYNGKVTQGRNELSIERGFYIVNGTKVVVR